MLGVVERGVRRIVLRGGIFATLVLREGTARRFVDEMVTPSLRFLMV